MTITEFILARVAEDEAAAQYVLPLGHVIDMGGNRLDETFNHHRWKHHSEDGRPYRANGGEMPHFSRWDPARVLAECVAKRRIVERHVPDRQLENWYWLERKCSECGKTWHKWLPNRLPTDIGPEQGCPTLRALAAIYAGHPDYDESWTL